MITTVEFKKVTFSSPYGQFYGMRAISVGGDNSLQIGIDGLSDSRLFDNLSAPVTSVSIQGGLAHVYFELARQKGFCDTAIEVGHMFLTALGIYENNVINYLRSMKITQVTEVKYRGTWMPYSQYLILTNAILKRVS